MRAVSEADGTAAAARADSKAAWAVARPQGHQSGVMFYGTEWDEDRPHSRLYAGGALSRYRWGSSAGGV